MTHTPTEPNNIDSNVPSNQQKEPSFNLKEEILSWIKIILFAACIAFFLNSCIIANSDVPTGSMENTIPSHSRILGLRLTYKFSEPERGDIAIFRYPDDESIFYVKRIIGLPGETVEIRNGNIYIDGNDVPLEEPYLKEEWTDYNDGYSFQVPENSYLMLGDNRNYSLDARFWNTSYVKKEKLIAKVYFEYFPQLKWLD